MALHKLTKDGLKKIQEEYSILVNKDRIENLEDLKNARAQGDLSENADYDAAKNRQAEIEARVIELEDIINHHEIIEDVKGSRVVVLTSTVEYKDLSNDTNKTIKIVPKNEAEPLKGNISEEAPVSLALMNHEVGDIVEVRAGREYKIQIIRIK